MMASPLRLYQYVGDPLLLALPPTERWMITSSQDLVLWRRTHTVDLYREGYVAATYVLDAECRLWLTHRRTEHVACARGGAVLAAGEIFLSADSEVGLITNQSTGYCPSCDCWGCPKPPSRCFGA
jgi:hypothetical protein